MAPPAPQFAPLVQAATSERLTGHVGHLLPHQEVAFDKFKSRLASDGYYTHETEDAEASHDSATLLRFLRARKFEVDGAYNQFTSAEDWRKAEEVEAIYDEFDVSEFEESQRVYPQWTGRRDNAGLPVYVFSVRALTKEAISKYTSHQSEDRLSTRMIALYEHMVQFALPFCSAIPHPHPETPVSATTTIVDISGVSLSRFWALRSHMQRASTLASLRYAETLGTIYIVGAPNFFSVVWGWVAKWFDPGTVEKIFILANDQVFPTLSRFIPPENIPKAYGGTLDWAYGDNQPLLDEPSKGTMGLSEVPRGSVRWVSGELVLKGTGRSAEEIERCTPPKKGAGEEDEEKVVVVVADEEKVVVVVADEEKVVVDDLVLPTVGAETEEKHDIWTAAREEPGAPVKELAAQLEGTTL